MKFKNSLFVMLIALVSSAVSHAQSGAPAAPAQPVAAQAESPSPSTTVNSDKPINSQLQQTQTVPTEALPEANVRSALPEPSATGPRFAPVARLLVETTRTLSPDEAANYGGWYQLTLGVQDKQSDMSLSLKTGYAREYSYERNDGSEGDLDNPILGLSKTWSEGKHFKSPVFSTISAGLSSSVAASRESRRRTFIASVGPSIAVSKKLRKFTLGQAFGYTRGFYEYDIRDNGVVNSPDQFRAATDLSYEITDELSLSASFAYTHAISYQGVGRGTQLTSASIDYQALKKLGFSLGVATERGTLEADGFTNSVRLFDQNVAQAFFDMILSF